MFAFVSVDLDVEFIKKSVAHSREAIDSHSAATRFALTSLSTASTCRLKACCKGPGPWEVQPLENSGWKPNSFADKRLLNHKHMRLV